MKSDQRKTPAIIYCTVTFLVMTTIIVAMVLSGRGRTSYDIVFFGDSRVGNDRSETALPGLLEKATGYTVLNAGLGGTTLAISPDDNINAQYTMVNLSKAVLLGDFGPQKAAIPKKYIENNEIIDYMPETIDKLSEVDFSKVRCFIIEQGTNDYLAGIPLTNPEDKYDEMSVEGALRKSIDNLRKVAPQAQIIVISQCDTFTLAGYGDEVDLSFGTEKDYADYEQQICEETGVSFVDFYDESGINRDNLFDFLFDGLHPNDAGNQVLIDMITEKLNLE